MKEKVLSSSIPLASQICCVVPADHLRVASVSNWGAYALAGALAIVAAQVLGHCLGLLR